MPTSNSELITPMQEAQLKSNGRIQRALHHQGDYVDLKPVVRLIFKPTHASWLITEILPDNPDQVYGLCDYGKSTPYLGWFSLKELAEIKGTLGETVTNDLTFEATKTIQEYAHEAQT